MGSVYETERLPTFRSQAGQGSTKRRVYARVVGRPFFAAICTGSVGVCRKPCAAEGFNHATQMPRRQGGHSGGRCRAVAAAAYSAMKSHPPGGVAEKIRPQRWRVPERQQQLAGRPGNRRLRATPVTDAGES